MTPDSGSDAMLAAASLFLCGAGLTLAGVGCRLRWPRSERRRRRRLSEMSVVFHAVAARPQRSKSRDRGP
jgi:hypothetical protein